MAGIAQKVKDVLTPGSRREERVEQRTGTATGDYIHVGGVLALERGQWGRGRVCRMDGGCGCNALGWRPHPACILPAEANKAANNAA